MRKRLLVVAAVAALAALAATVGTASRASASPKLTKVSIQLQWVPQAQFAGYFAALDLGYYKAAGLDVKLLNGGPQIVPGQVVAAGVQQLELTPSGARQPDQPDPLVRWVGLELHQTLVLELAQQAAQVAGVQVQPGPQRAEVGAATRCTVDLPQHPGGAQRPAPGEVLVVQGADPLGHDPVEAPDGGDFAVGHSLTLVRE